MRSAGKSTGITPELWPELSDGRGFCQGARTRGEAAEAELGPCGQRAESCGIPEPHELRLVVQKGPYSQCLQSFGFLYLKHCFTGLCVSACIYAEPRSFLN